MTHIMVLHGQSYIISFLKLFDASKHMCNYESWWPLLNLLIIVMNNLGVCCQVTLWGTNVDVSPWLTVNRIILGMQFVPEFYINRLLSPRNISLMLHGIHHKKLAVFQEYPLTYLLFKDDLASIYSNNIIPVLNYIFLQCNEVWKHLIFHFTSVFTDSASDCNMA